MFAFMFEITRIHNDVEWCIELMSMQASVSISASCRSPSAWVPLTTIVRKDTPSPSVENFHVKDQHKQNLAVTIDVEVSSPCGKNKDHLVVEAPMDPTTMVCQERCQEKIKVG